MEDIESTVKYYCGYLTHEQEMVMLAMIKQNRVIGVARAIGGISYCPLVSFGKQQPNVIDGAGYYQLAAKDGMRLFDPISDYYNDRANSSLANRAR